MKRREFLFGGGMMPAFVKPQNTIHVEVLEVFSSSSGTSALLVHHADQATRDTFANWLRRNSGRRVRCQPRNGTPIAGRIFRVSLCFGRGLILFPSPAQVRSTDILSVLLDQ
jgi:hypothetical protein